MKGLNKGILLGAALTSVLSFALGGCQLPPPDTFTDGPDGGAYVDDVKDGGDTMQGNAYGEDVPNPDVPDLVSEGETKGIYYAKGGSMQARSDFMIEVSPEEIVKARFWPTGGDDTEIKEIEHVPISEEDWQDLERIIRDLRGFMSVNSSLYYGDSKKMEETVQVSDDRPYTHLYLTLAAKGEEDKIPYIPPQDRRFLTLENLLMELVDPIGREIVWYEEPELVGIYFSNDGKGYSYQCTNFQDSYRYYAYSNFLKNSFVTDVSDEVWDRVNEFCDSIGILDRAIDDNDYKIGGTLYMSDGSQKCFEVDKKTAETMRAFFEETAEEIKSGELK